MSSHRDGDAGPGVHPLEQALRDLGRHLDGPDVDITASVLARIDASRSRGVGGRFRARRRRVIAVVIATIVAVGGLATVPAVGQWLGIRGVAVHSGPPPSTPATTRPGLDRPDLGLPITLPQAASAAGFEPVLPRGLGPPEGVWLDRRGTVPVLSLVYEGDVLISELRASIGSLPVIQKFAGPGVTIEELTVDGRRGLWIHGPHSVALQTDQGTIQDLRTTGDALLLERGSLSVRIETSQGRDAAIGIAASLL